MCVCFFLSGQKKKRKEGKIIMAAVAEKPKTKELDAIFIPHDITDRQSWYSENVPIFNNMTNIDQDVGYIKPIIDYDEFKNRCYENCNQLSLTFPENCKWFCDYKTNLKLDSVKFAKEACPSRDAACCKKEAKDNDFAYLYCIGTKDLFRNNPMTYRVQTLFYIVLFLSIAFLFLCFICIWIFL